MYPIFSRDIRIKKGYKIEKNKKAEVKAKAGNKAKRLETEVGGRTDRIDTFFNKIKINNRMSRPEHSENRDTPGKKAGQKVHYESK